VDWSVRNKLLAITVSVSVILGLLIAIAIVPRPMTGEQMQEIGLYRFDSPKELSEFTMIDHRGNEVGLSAFKGRWTLMFFGFTTCPDICPTTLGVLNEVVRNLDQPPQVVMVTVDRERDTPERLKAYVPAFNSEFRGLAGNFNQTLDLAEQLNVAFTKIPVGETGNYLINHTASIFLIDPEARYAGYIKGPHRAKHIQEALRYL